MSCKLRAMSKGAGFADKYIKLTDNNEEEE